MKYEYIAWPTETFHIAVDKVEADTGRVIKTKLTKSKRTWAWWKTMGFVKLPYGKTVTIGRA